MAKMLTSDKIKNGENKSGQILSWHCPKCGHTMTNTEYQAARFNYECPGQCGLYLSDYVPDISNGDK